VHDLAPAKPIIFAGMDDGADVPQQYIDDLRAAGVPYFPTPDRVFRALAQVHKFAARNYAQIKTPNRKIALPDSGVIPEYRAKALLRPLGISFPDSALATTPGEAREIAARLGYPLVLKAQSPDLSHKSDAGGVIVGITDDAGLMEGWAKMHSSVSAYAPGIALDGLLLEKMGTRGLELIVGAKNDPEWGPVILAGFGGVQAEILKDVRLLCPGMTRNAIIMELHALKSGALLRGFRGAPPLDVGAVADIIMILGGLLLAEPSIREIDLNPVVVYPQGQGALVLDALMLVGA
jgi:acetate---CoA ligase (ADP-forming)